MCPYCEGVCVGSCVPRGSLLCGGHMSLSLWRAMQVLLTGIDLWHESGRQSLRVHTYQCNPRAEKSTEHYHNWPERETMTETIK